MRIDTLLSQTFLGATGDQIAQRLPLTSRKPTGSWPEESFWRATPDKVLIHNPGIRQEVDRIASLTKLGLSIDELLNIEDPNTFKKTDETSELAVGLWLVIVSMHLWKSQQGAFATFPQRKTRDFFFWLHAWWKERRQGEWKSSPVLASHTHICLWRDIASCAFNFTQELTGLEKLGAGQLLNIMTEQSLREVRSCPIIY